MTTIRIKQSTHDKLKELKSSTHIPIIELVDLAIENLSKNEIVLNTGVTNAT